jgi:GNAT superfamily N-acetyltransferase
MIKPDDRLAQLIEDWKSYFKRKTLKQAVRMVAKEALQLPCRHIHYLIIARSLLDPFPELTTDPHLAVRKFDPSDLAGVAEIDRPSEARMYARRLAGGQTGVAALHDRMLVGFAWASKKVDLDIERFNLKLELSDFLCTDAYTAPAHRRSGVQKLLILERLKLFRELGSKRAICYIESTNLPSLKAWKKLGGYVIGEIDYFRFGIWRWTRTSYHTPAQIEMHAVPING